MPRTSLLVILLSKNEQYNDLAHYLANFYQTWVQNQTNGFTSAKNIISLCQLAPMIVDCHCSVTKKADGNNFSNKIVKLVNKWSSNVCGFSQRLMDRVMSSINYYHIAERCFLTNPTNIFIFHFNKKCIHLSTCKLAYDNTTLVLMF